MSPPEIVRPDSMAPDWPKVRIAADQIRHPLLPTVTFDERDGLSLDEVAVLAVVLNPSLRTIRSRQDLADAQLLLAGLLPNPKLSFDVANPVGGDTQDSVRAFGVGLDWDVTALFSRSARQEAARLHGDSIALDVAWQEWQVAGAARRAALRLAVAGRRAEATRQIEAVQEQRLQGTRRQTADGLQSPQELFAAETALREARMQRLQAESLREEDRLALNRLLGLPPEQLISLDTFDHPALQPSPAAGVLCRDLENRRLDLLALKLGCESQDARVRAVVRSRFPAIDIGLTGGRETDGVKTVGAGVSIELPFFDQKQGAVATERATQKMLAAEYRERLFTARADIARLTEVLSEACHEAAQLKEMLSAQSARVQGMRNALAAGQVGVSEDYNAEVSRGNVRIRLADIEEQVVDLRIVLELAAGSYNLSECVDEEVLQ